MAMAMMRGALLLFAATAAAGCGLRAAGPDDPAPAMATAARSFLSGLDSAKRAKANLPFNSDERLNWHFAERNLGL